MTLFWPFWSLSEGNIQYQSRWWFWMIFQSCSNGLRIVSWEKCFGVSKNLFLASEHVFKLSWRRNMIQYSQDAMWRSGVLHVVLSVFLLIEDSRKLCLSRNFKDHKHVLMLVIDSLNPLNTFPYPGYNSRTIRTTLKIHQKSSPWFLLYFTFRKAPKGPKYGHFRSRFLRFSRFWVMISKIALRGETTSQSTTKNIISVRGLLP